MRGHEITEGEPMESGSPEQSWLEKPRLGLFILSLSLCFLGFCLDHELDSPEDTNNVALVSDLF